MNSQKQFRNKTLQTGKTSEKILWHRWGVAGQVIGCNAGFRAYGQMQRFLISLMGVFLGISLVTAAVGESSAKVAITRSEHCTHLSHQFDDALKTHATATQVAAAKALQRRGNRYCANMKQAQGIRMLANALKLLGVAPIDTDQ